MQPLQVDAARQRLQQYHDEGREATLRLRLKALDGATEIFDEFFESLRTVVLFNEWKVHREKLWEDWLAAQQHHMTIFNALHDRTAFAGSMYEDSSLQLMKLSRWKKNIRKGQSLLVEQQTERLRELHKSRAPLYIGEHREAPPQQAVAPSIRESGATSSNIGTSGTPIVAGKNVRRQRNAFEQLMIDRMRELRIQERSISSIDSAPNVSAVPSPHNKVKFIIV